MTYYSFIIGGTFEKNSDLNMLIKLVHEFAGVVDNSGTNLGLRTVAKDVISAWNDKACIVAEGDADVEDAENLQIFLNERKIPFQMYVRDDGEASTSHNNMHEEYFVYAEDNSGNAYLNSWDIEAILEEGNAEAVLGKWVERVQTKCPPLVLKGECADWAAIELAKIAHKVTAEDLFSNPKGWMK